MVLVPTWLSLIQPQISEETLYFSRDVLKLISPGGILVAKTGAHTHKGQCERAVGLKNTPTYK